MYYNSVMLHIVLVEPEIPQNTGNIARTCAATGSMLHLVRPLGFTLDDRYLKRAGLDYWDSVEVRVHDSLEEALSALGKPFWLFTTKARTCYTDVAYGPDDVLVFGKETAGLPEELLVAHPASCVRIPMLEGKRSLNLSNCVAVAAYEALRRQNFTGLAAAGELHRLQW